jgi:hypothetical protein
LTPARAQRLDTPTKAAPRRKPAGEPPASAITTQVRAARITRGTAVPLALDEDSSALSLTSWLLIVSFGASVLLLALAAVPPAWSLRLPGYSARLVDARDVMMMAGGILLIESGVIALMLAS